LLTLRHEPVKELLHAPDVIYRGDLGNILVRSHDDHSTDLRIDAVSLVCVTMIDIVVLVIDIDFMEI
jgi:hypothetical protein